MERIDPGNQTWRLANTPQVVSIDDASLQRIHEFYGSFIETIVPVSSVRTAEMTKLLENTFRHVNIALVNEIASVARAPEWISGSRSTAADSSRSGSCASRAPV